MSDTNNNNRTGQGRCELMWDLPNETTTFAELSGPLEKQAKLYYPALSRWVAQNTTVQQPGTATVFTNVRGRSAGFQSFLLYLRSLGFGVFARPQVDNSDIDDDVVAHVSAAAHDLEHLLVGTHDRELLERCVSAVPAGCRVSVLGFEEKSNWAVASPRVDFIDLADIPGLIKGPLTRTLLRLLPPEGVLLPPLAALGRCTRPLTAA